MPKKFLEPSELGRSHNCPSKRLKCRVDSLKSLSFHLSISLSLIPLPSPLIT